MHIKKILIRFMAVCLLYCGLPAVADNKTGKLPLDKIKLPTGFSIEVWAEVPNARGLALGKNGTVFAGSMAEGNIYAITDKGNTREVKTIAKGLNLPIGVAFREGALYASSVDRILRFDDIEEKLDQPGKPSVVTERFPNEKHHGGRYIGFGPDGLLYVAGGAPCNDCGNSDRRPSNCSTGSSA